MNDRELLEMAAKANNDPKIYKDIGEFYRIIGRNEDMGCDVLAIWNPLNDDGDCARLEAAIGIDVEWYTVKVVAQRTITPVSEEIYCEFEQFHGDKNKARRYASTKCAAEIGRNMK